MLLLLTKKCCLKFERALAKRSNIVCQTFEIKFACHAKMFYRLAMSQNNACQTSWACVMQKMFSNFFKNITQRILLIHACQAMFVTWTNIQTFLDRQISNVWQTLELEEKGVESFLRAENQNFRYVGLFVKTRDSEFDLQGSGI